MPSDRPFGEPDDDTALLRPAWEDTPDETDVDRGITRWRPAAPRRATGRTEAWPADDALRGLLAPRAPGRPGSRGRRPRWPDWMQERAQPRSRCAPACWPAWRWRRPPAGWRTAMPGCTRSTSPCARPGSPPAPRWPSPAWATVPCR